ncbi:4a-hydroxytetrahydrobiopterin dehydratase [Nocardioides oleivorans]|uniref:Putative pterin-4-alpha-carbinolamine dehydratase n=1 Tax=Nocardioides oleivorans TaxID=273676 RepID=A0A4Q2RZZ8_9ACTN|nr:VOC family protein [Nocardioides oleivorans]RYB94456.1 4a-hydroxytetrahydrobiopterin dehydratase [Nocardioides oleivorans]
MDMIPSAQITEAGLTDWRKLAQGLHARYLVDSFADGVRLVSAISDAGDEVGHHPRVVIGNGHVDLELVTPDAIYRDDDGTEYVVEWPTQQDLDLARTIASLASDLGLTADPASVAELELGLNVDSSSDVAPVWAALLTGDLASQGRGSPSDEVRDGSNRVANLWFDDLDEDAAPGQRFHVEVYVAAEARDARVAAALAAGGTVVDDSQAPGLTVIADQEGNRGVICVA